MSRILRFGLLALVCAVPLGLASNADAAPYRYTRGRACYAAPTAYRWYGHHGHGYRHGYRHYHR